MCLNLYEFIRNAPIFCKEYSTQSLARNQTPDTPRADENRAHFCRRTEQMMIVCVITMSFGGGSIILCTFVVSLCARFLASGLVKNLSYSREHIAAATSTTATSYSFVLAVSSGHRSHVIHVIRILSTPQTQQQRFDLCDSICVRRRNRKSSSTGKCAC